MVDDDDLDHDLDDDNDDLDDTDDDLGEDNDDQDDDDIQCLEDVIGFQDAVIDNKLEENKNNPKGEE